MRSDDGQWAAEAFARSFASLCEGTVGPLLADTHGPDHLDVGCGTGALASAAAGLGRAVTAVDSDRGMVEHARRHARGVDVHEMTLPHLDLPSARFDCVTANFVINHVSDPQAALQEMARVTRPTGRIAVTIWTSQLTAQSTLFADTLAAAGAVTVSGQRLPADRDFERSVKGLARLARRAGLTPIREREVNWIWRTTWDALWAGVSGGVASIGQTYLAQNAATPARIETEMHDRAQRLEVDGSLHIPSTAAYLLATP